MKLKHNILYLSILLASCSQNNPGTDQNNQTNTQAKNQSLLQQINNRDIGINFKHDSGFSDEYSIYEPLGSGLAVIDYDNDGDMDIFFAQYGRKSNESKLYSNNGFKFVDVTQSLGLSGITDLVFASVADFNNDGWQDLLVGGEDILQLWENNKGQGFKLSDKIKSPAGKQFFTGATWFDMDHDGDLDLWVINYVNDRNDQRCHLKNGLPGYCAPKAYPYLQNSVFINHNGQYFQESPDFPNLEEAAPALGIVADDFDNNGWSDVYIANDGVPNHLFMNFNGKMSNDEAMKRGAAVNLMGESEASMGIAKGDINNDSFPDLYLTHLMGETNTFYINNNGYFIDKTVNAKLTQHVRPQTGFGTLFADINADNLLDIMTVNGSIHNTEDTVDEKNRLAGEPVQIWLQQNGFRFEYQQDLADTIKKKVGRGLISADLDNDGDVDFMINNNNGTPTVLKNNTDPGSWIGLELICNKRHDYNAQVKYKTSVGNLIYKSVQADGSFASSIDSRVLLYQTDLSEPLEVVWTSGQKQLFELSELELNKYNKINCK
jgi:hypothetical protein